MKYVKINPTKYVQDLYAENYNTNGIHRILHYLKFSINGIIICFFLHVIFVRFLFFKYHDSPFWPAKFCVF